MIELRSVKKFFPSNAVTALENAELKLKAGEILALLGENGSGKSTLMHILAGYFQPSSGAVLVDGKKRHFRSPADALRLGIGMVRQHPGFIRGFKVWEDCTLGAETLNPMRNFRPFFFNPRLAKKRVEETAAQWQITLPLGELSDSLTVSQRQKAAVLALLLRKVKFFIFDEPTAVLTPDESKALFELFTQLRKEGCGIILITHKLEEALAVSDRFIIINNGVTQEARNTREHSAKTLQYIINGKQDFIQISSHKDEAKEQKEKREDKKEKGKKEEAGFSKCAESPVPPCLCVTDLSIEAPGLPHIRNINLELKPGEIIGIAGVRDSGLETLELAIVGLLNRTGKFGGKITLNGEDITGKGVRAFRKAGGAYLGADRLGTNLAPGLPLFESLIIHVFRSAQKGIFLDLHRLKNFCKAIMDRAEIDRPVTNKAISFSGGMLQRILLAREFAEDAPLLVLAEPGSGLDQRNSEKLMEELKSYTGRGKAVLLFSTDMEELISLTDEILILRNGALEKHVQ